MIWLVILMVTRVLSERIHVVTPESQLTGEVTDAAGELNATNEVTDSYLQAYRDVHNIAERRNPLGSYADDAPYSTLVHSSYIDDDFYPEFSYKGSNYKPQKYHSPPAVVYGPPAPVSYYHHYHHPETTHHTIIGFPLPLHIMSSYFAKFGLHKIIKLIAKIAVLKVILKFVSIVALFFVLPSLMPKMKDKDESDDDRMIDNLNGVTDFIWNGISEVEKMEEMSMNDHENHGDTTPDKEKDKDKNENDGLDEVDYKLLNKLIKEWKDENFGGPDKGSAVDILRHCVDIVNRVLGFMLGVLKMKNKNMDVMDSIIFSKFTKYMKDAMKIWPKFTVSLTG